MKHFSKAAAILAASVLCLAFLGCKNSTNEDDGNSISKLETPTNLGDIVKCCGLKFGSA